MFLAGCVASPASTAADVPWDVGWWGQVPTVPCGPDTLLTGCWVALASCSSSGNQRGAGSIPGTAPRQVLDWG